MIFIIRTKIFEQFLDGSLVSIHHDALLIQHQDVHGQPLGGHPEWMIYDRSDDIIHLYCNLNFSFMFDYFNRTEKRRSLLIITPLSANKLTIRN